MGENNFLRKACVLLSKSAEARMLGKHEANGRKSEWEEDPQAAWLKRDRDQLAGFMSLPSNSVNQFQRIKPASAISSGWAVNLSPL